MEKRDIKYIGCRYATPGGWKSLASSQVQRERVDKGGRRVVPFHRRSTTQWDACPSVPANAPRWVISAPISMKKIILFFSIP